jgi:hypothetical protein
VRTEGDWERQVTTARRVIALFDAERARIEAIGRRVGSALRVHDG